MRRARTERGQILPIVALALVALLGVCAFSVDVGYAYFAKRQLQSATDAAALAGAQDLPNGTTAIATATSYGLANSPVNLPAFTFTYQLKCTATAIVATGCTASVNPNELLVSATATTDTWFAGLFGVKHFNVTAHANACSPCSSTPVDVMIAIDRTGSMCDTKDSGTNFCTDLDNAKEGVQTLLGTLNPPYAQIGMVAFPPVQTTSTSVCSAPYNSLSGSGWDGYDSASRGYLTDALNGSYKLNGNLNPASGLVLHTTDGKATACVEAGGSTSYSEALRQAKAELDKDGRPNVPDYIVFLTDGEANLGSVYGVNSSDYPPGGPDDQEPCHTAIDLANGYKKLGITIYSIGYAIGTKNCTAGKWPYIAAVPAVTDKKGKIITPAVPGRYCNPASDSNCQHEQGSAAEVGPSGDTITSRATLSAIASPGNYYEKASAGDLNTIFAAIATDIGQGSSRLVDDSF
jgi:Flp pilus assembly protein TadG